MEKVEYIQPKIYRKFKCDGSKCNSHCCKEWLISVDDQTMEKYRELGLESHLQFNDKLNQNIFILKPDGQCPMLDDDGLCKIQKQYGEDFLSITCKIYPRLEKNFNDHHFERTLTLTCPVAADLILRQKKSIEFESIKDFPIFNNKSKLGIGLNELQLNNVLNLRMTIIKILQNRRMTIDQRLLTVGFFFSEVGDVYLGGGNHAEQIRDNIRMLEKLCMSKKFSKEFLTKFCKAVEFDSHEFIRIMLKILETMYGNDSKFQKTRKELQKYFESHDTVLEIIPNPSGSTKVSISFIAEKYLKLEKTYNRLKKDFSYAFENFLVNEFWIQIYPYRFENISVLQHYYFFLISYKLQEFLLTLHIENLYQENNGKLKDSQIENEIVNIFSTFSTSLVHNINFIETMSNISKIKGEDILGMMNSMLRV